MNRLPHEGESFGRYRLLRLLGQGGMGVVYAAQDTTLDREVAVKLVVPHLAGDEGFRARFQHEAAVLAKLESPRIVRIYDHGEHDDTLFLVTQLVDGGDLHRLIRREGALPPGLAVGVLGQVLEGLCDAHAVGVTHRDIKPANVLLRDRGREVEAFLCDFGIATTPGAELSRTGTIAGSLPYMAPERHQGEDAGAQGDVYSAGCLLWHALTGTAPYSGTDVEVAVAHIQAPIPQLPGEDEFSTGVNTVLARSLAKERADRYPTARAMLAELTALRALAPDAITLPGATAIRHRVTALPTAPPTAPPAPPRRRSRARAAIAALVAVAAVVGGAAYAFSATGNGPGDLVAGLPGVGSTTPTPQGGIGPTSTLLPRPVTSTSGGEQVTTVPSEELREEPPPAVVEPEPGGTPSRPADTTTRAPQPATSAPPAPRTYAYRCWHGGLADDLATCGTPTGRDGARWMLDVLSGCYLASPGDGRVVESWGCGYHTGSGKNIVYVLRATSREAAAAYLRDRMPDNRVGPNAWYTGTVRAGSAYQGTAGSGTSKRYRWGRFWSMGGEAWAVYVTATTADERRWARTETDGHYRHLNQVYGVPCTSACS